jgi:hypothetical protein
MPNLPLPEEEKQAIARVYARIRPDYKNDKAAIRAMAETFGYSISCVYKYKHFTGNVTDNIAGNVTDNIAGNSLSEIPNLREQSSPPIQTTPNDPPLYKDLEFTPQISADYEIKTRQPRILLFDIETAPNISYVWGHYEQNVLQHVQEWYMLAFCAKWIDGEVISKCLPDYTGYEPKSNNDKAIVEELWKLFNEADVLIAHNGDRFDVTKANARFIYHGLTPPAPYKTIDTKKVAKRYFRFNSNKLDDLGNHLGVGRKIKHTGFELWNDCINGDLEQWEIMRMYNRQDVLLLEKVYNKLKPWMTNHPNLSILSEIEDGCPVCAAPFSQLAQSGFSITATGKKRRYQCLKCNAWCVGKHQKVTDVR